MHRGHALFLCALACFAATSQHLGCSLSDPSGPQADTDGDGLSDAEELNVWSTSPVLSDTDGDGLSDYEEVVKMGFDPTNDPYTFNPLIADVPRMTITLVDGPLVRLQLQDTQGVTYTMDNSESVQAMIQGRQAINNHYGRSDTVSQSQTNSRQVSVTEPTTSTSTTTAAGSDDGGTPPADAGADAAAPDGGGGGGGGGVTATTNTVNGPVINLTDSISTTTSASTTFDTSVDYTNEQILQNTDTLTRSQGIQLSHQITASGGIVAIAVVIKNTSHLGFRVSNVTLWCGAVDDVGRVVTIHNLNLDQGIDSTFQPFSLAPGESTGPTMFLTDVSLQGAQRALSARSMRFRLATYELDDATGKSYSFATNVDSRTALVVLDYGKLHAPELYQVATNFDPSHPGVAASKVFGDILRIPYTAAKDAGLLSVRNLQLDSSGGPRWRVERFHIEGPQTFDVPYGADGTPYDFDSIELHSGDVLHVAWVGSGNPSVWSTGGGNAIASFQQTDAALPASGDVDAGLPPVGLGDAARPAGWDQDASLHPHAILDRDAAVPLIGAHE